MLRTEGEAQDLLFVCSYSSKGSMDLKAYLQEKRVLIDQTLDRLLPGEQDYPQELHKAMRYSLFAGGKRLRPILALAACEAVGGSLENALAYASALEMIHTYSLIHDDLPPMDDDDLRRGLPTNHKAFGEAVAILAGDALLTHAFYLLPDPELSSLNEEQRLRIVREIALAAGSMGMVGGQAVDILSEGQAVVDLPILEYIHTHKTGAMIRVALRVGAIAGAADEVQLADLTEYGEKIGLSFQITDDLLDLLGDEKQLGKKIGSDRRRGKKTYPVLFGIQESKMRAKELMEGGLDALVGFDHHADPLRSIARFIVERMN
jgi:geranylgeranyl diphosphate synthase type II